jgi:succinate dehydrogenase / fumarate reductase, iron-sulfur subunit
MPVIKDLVPDLTHFYAQYASIKPWLRTQSAAAAGPRAPAVAGGPQEARRPVRVHPVRLLLDQLPELLVERRPLPRPGGAAAGLPLDRRQRDEDTGARLDELEDPFRLYRCHTIMNCTRTCPKGLNPPRRSPRSRS